VQALYAGRRITDEGTEIAVVAVWRDRLSLHAFARSRPTGAIDPAFSSQLEPWLFETYDCLPPDRLTIPPTGPATLVVDEAGRCVDATPGVEGVLGMPGELLIGKGLGEVLDGTSRGVLDEALGADRTASVRLRMMPWPGTATEVAAEIDGDVRRDGLRTITLRSVEAGVTAGERRTIPA
ncbi:MAG TPA: PAS domain-containing protein, partial [Candidatus Limnocylindrales bacterium]